MVGIIFMISVGQQNIVSTGGGGGGDGGFSIAKGLLKLDLGS